MSAALTRSAFEACLGSPFELLDVGAPVALHLDAVSALPGAPEDDTDSFTLTFVAPTVEHMLQGTYRLRREGWGEEEVFLVPVTSSAAGLVVEAVFNRQAYGPADVPGPGSATEK